MKRVEHLAVKELNMFLRSWWRSNQSWEESEYWKIIKKKSYAGLESWHLKMEHTGKNPDIIQKWEPNELASLPPRSNPVTVALLWLTTQSVLQRFFIGITDAPRLLWQLQCASCCFSRHISAYTWQEVSKCLLLCQLLEVYRIISAFLLAGRFNDILYMLKKTRLRL